MDPALILYKQLKDAEYRTLEYGLLIAIGMSSGPFKLPELRALEYPYAKDRPHPPIPPAIINQQSGVFAESWRIEMFYGGVESGVFGRLVNISPEADFIEASTDPSNKMRMMARPISTILEREMNKVREINLELAVLQTIKEVAAASA